MADALFTDLDDDHVQPTELTRGPWSPDAQHGGPVAALVARAAERALAATGAPADFVNGISGVLPFEHWTFINPDLTVTLHRLPVGEWVALDAVSRLDPSGVGTAEAELFDEQGRLGRCVQTLVVEGR